MLHYDWTTNGGQVIGLAVSSAAYACMTWGFKRIASPPNSLSVSSPIYQLNRNVTFAKTG